MLDWIDRRPAWMSNSIWFVLLLVPSLVFRWVLVPLMLERDDPIGNTLKVPVVAIPVVAIAAWMAYVTSCRVSDRSGSFGGHLAFWISLAAALGQYLIPWFE